VSQYTDLAALLEKAAGLLREADAALSGLPRPGRDGFVEGISVRARKTLNRLEIKTWGELARRTERELLDVKGFGMTTLYELREKLKAKGFAFREE
jgi:hypothetical protein